MLNVAGSEKEARNKHTGCGIAKRNGAFGFQVGPMQALIDDKVHDGAMRQTSYTYDLLHFGPREPVIVFVKHAQNILVPFTKAEKKFGTFGRPLVFG
ncbi:MAG: hypothetical protein Q9184_000418 [Pyrenodesmia sp. 2 TL-2023]